jgi:hypothetical protein
MSIIGIILGLVLICLIIKAIYETILGICLIINGLFWHAIGFALDLITFIPRLIHKIGSNKKRKALDKKHRAMMADPLIADLLRIGSYRPQNPQKETPKQSCSLSVARLSMKTPTC